MKKAEKQITERRRYIRLETVFPVEFQVLSTKTGETVSGLRQGFTKNVSEGGICLEVNELENGFMKDILSSDTELLLCLDVPNVKEPFNARSRVRWSKKIKEDFHNKYLLGLEYVQIQEEVRKEIIGYAKKMSRRPKLIALSICLLIIACGALMWQIHNISFKKGITEKRLLVLGEILSRAHEKRISLENKIYTLNIEQGNLKKDIGNSKEMINQMEEKLSKMAGIGNNLSDELISQKIKLEGRLAHWQKERESLMSQMDKLTKSKEYLNSELEKIKGLSSAKIVRIRLVNGNYIIGQLLDLSHDRINIKIGLGTIGIERSMVAAVKEVSTLEKIDIQKEWARQEENAKKDAEEYQKYLEAQKKKGLAYFNGRWIREDEVKRIKEELKEKEEEVFRLISSQHAQKLSSPNRDLLNILLDKDEKPLIFVKDRRIYVNGRLFFIKGVGYGIEYPGTNGGMDTFKKVPFSIFEKDFRMIKEAGINTIRTYEPLPESLMDLAEKYGIMVIENICYPSDNTDFNSRVHLGILKEQVKRYVLRDKDRRCILMWSIWNDAPWAWGANGNVVQRYGFSKVNSFLKELYDTVKQYDISRPVTAGNAISLEGEKLGWDFLDIIGLNIYLGGYDWFIEKEAEKNIAEIRSIEEKYDKPVVILETGFSTFIKEQDQAEVLERQIKIAGTSVSGVTIFQWADGWQKAGAKDKQDYHIEEYWGILDGYRNPKQGYKTVSKMFNKIKTDSYGFSEDKQKL